MAAAKSVKTVNALATRTVLWWNVKVFAPGTALCLFCTYGVPAIVDAARAGGAS